MSSIRILMVRLGNFFNLTQIACMQDNLHFIICRIHAILKILNWADQSFYTLLLDVLGYVRKYCQNAIAKVKTSPNFIAKYSSYELEKKLMSTLVYHLLYWLFRYIAPKYFICDGETIEFCQFILLSRNLSC